MKKKLLPLLLALVMCLGLTTPALAEYDFPTGYKWENTTDVHNYEEFAAALKDRKVAEIRVVGEVVIPETDEPIDSDKPILITVDGKLTLEPGAEMHNGAGMGLFYFEDYENTWDRIVEMCEAFLLWKDEDGGYHRDIFGTQPQDMISDPITHSPAYLTTGCFSGAEVSLNVTDKPVEIETLLVVGDDHDFIVGKDVDLTFANGFSVNANLYLNEGAKLTIKKDDTSGIGGDLFCADPAQIPENLEVGGEYRDLEGNLIDVETPNAFTDVAEDSPFKNAIGWAVRKNITKGTSATTFGPSTTCTHNHILTFLWRANGSPEAEGEGDFAKAIAWAKAEGLAETVDGAAPCTRAQTMVYLWKLAGSPETEVNSAFTDVAADADYAQAVAWAVEQGITNGTTPTTFSPENTCTRGQIVTFLYRNRK